MPGLPQSVQSSSSAAAIGGTVGGGTFGAITYSPLNLGGGIPWPAIITGALALLTVGVLAWKQ